MVDVLNDLKKTILCHIEKIQDAIENNRLIIFVGAGVSIGSGFPSWNELICALAEDLGLDGGLCGYSSDSAIKIPQYHYNKFKKVKYIKKINDIFSNEYKCNILHKIIFDLNPQHIITTNFDNLLENYAKENLLKFTTVAKDCDLYENKNNKFIIKMHGDLVNNNFVLKDDDYSSYSENFKLIETYIKGLFSTHTILFIGFSAKDPNVRQVFKWIKQILSKYKSAYLLDIDSIASNNYFMESQYLKNLGIISLPFFVLEDDINSICAESHKAVHDKYLESTKSSNLIIDTKSNNLTQKTFNFLYCIQQNAFQNNIENYCNILKKLDVLQYCPNEIRAKAFDNPDLSFELRAGGFSNPIYSELKHKFSITHPKKYALNVSLLLGSYLLTDAENDLLTSIYSGRLDRQDKIVENNKAQLDKIISNIKKKVVITKSERSKIKYLFKQIFEHKDNLNHLTKNHKFLVNRQINKINIQITPDLKDSTKIFEKAFFLYKTERYEEAYREIQQISYDAFRQENLFLHCLAEKNRHYLMQCLLYKRGAKNTAINKETIKKEYYGRDLFALYDKTLSKFENKVLRWLLTDDYLEKLNRKILKRNSDILNDKASSWDTAELRKLAHKAYYNLVLNFNFTENSITFREIFKHYAQGMLLSFGIKDGNQISKYKISGFEYLDLYLITEHVNHNDLKSFIKLHGINALAFDKNERTKAKFIRSFENYVDSITKLDLQDNVDDKIFNYLLIFSIAELNNRELIKILNAYFKLCDFMEKNYVDETGFTAEKDIILLKMIVSTHNHLYTKRKRIKNETLEFAIIKTLSNITCYEICKNLARDANTKELINCLSDLIKTNKGQPNYKFINQDFLHEFLKHCKNIGYLHKILPNLYGFANAKIQASYKKIIKSYLDSCSDENYIEILYDSVENDIINMNKKLENRLFKIFLESIEKVYDSSRNLMSSLDYYNVLIRVLNFNIIGKWHSKETLEAICIKLRNIDYTKVKFFPMDSLHWEKMKEIIECIEFFNNMENTNYTTFNIKHTRFLNPSKLNDFRKYLDSNPSKKKAVKKAFLSVCKFDESIYNNSRYKDAFDELFC